MEENKKYEKCEILKSGVRAIKYSEIDRRLFKTEYAETYITVNLISANGLIELFKEIKPDISNELGAFVKIMNVENEQKLKGKIFACMDGCLENALKMLEILKI